MLTVLRYFSPTLNDIHNSIMVEWCIAKSKEYLKKDKFKKCAYWSKQSTKYLLKRIDYLHKKGLL